MQSTVSNAFIVREIGISDLFGAVRELAQKHRDELATEKDIMVLDPDMVKYQMLEDQGILLSLVCYNQANVVGYSVGFVGQHLHYRGMTFYQNDVLFVDQAVRKLGAGGELIRKTEELAAGRGAKFITWHAKKDTALCSVMDVMGYRVQDVVYSKRI
jgi:predicted GNAT superfamily acetyltransferase